MKDINFKLKTIEEKVNYGKFTIEPLKQGYGQTLGNALRRVLLSSLKGAAITSIKFEDVKHPFSTIPGMKEDGVEFTLNVKKLRLKIEDDNEHTLTIDATGPAELTAAAIEVPAAVTIINKDLYLSTLNDKKTKLSVRFIARAGYGYVPSEEQVRKEYGSIPIDSIFSPVTRVNYKVEETRVGSMTNLDKLTIEVWTDGSITPSDSIKESAKILSSYFHQIVEPRPEEIADTTELLKVSDEVLKLTIEELDLPMRITNSLKNGGIETVEQLINTPRETLSKIKNLGVKSLTLIEEKIKGKGLSLSPALS